MPDQVRHDGFWTFYEAINLDGLVKSPKIPFSVIPAKAGIQSFQAVADHLDSGFHRSDDFLRVCHILGLLYNNMNWPKTY